MATINPQRIPIEKDLQQRALAMSRPNGWMYTAWLSLYLPIWAGLLVLVIENQSSLPWLFILSFLIGNQLHTITVLQHECGHQSAYNSARANRWVGRFLAWFIFMPFTTFTELHRFHHGFLGDPKKDPDEWFYERGPVKLFMREGLFLPRFIFLSLTRPHIKPSMRRTIVFEFAFNIVSYAALITFLVAIEWTMVLIFGFLLPMLWLALVLNPISRGFEHYPLSLLPENDPARRDLRHNTVTVTSPIMGFLWANITYHVEHHLFPRVPFYRLPALHRLLREHDYLRVRWPLWRGSIPKGGAKHQASRPTAGFSVRKNLPSASLPELTSTNQEKL
jgi:beta-carotene hydroxylase